jgi:heme/copper-type cytochrome/quinol oxidase subunit 2
MNGMPIIVWACAAIGVAVFAAMIASTLSFRALPREGPATVASSKVTEFVWALVPIAIMLATAIPALRMSEFVQVPGGRCTLQRLAACIAMQQAAPVLPLVSPKGDLSANRSSIAQPLEVPDALVADRRLN